MQPTLSAQIRRGRLDEAGDLMRSKWIPNPVKGRDVEQPMLKIRNALRRSQERIKTKPVAMAEQRERERSTEEAFCEAPQDKENVCFQSVAKPRKQIWEVGADIDGIVANVSLDTKSHKLGRLMSGARIEEVQCWGNRLQYRKIDGEGPDMGWVHIRLKRKIVLKPEKNM